MDRKARVGEINRYVRIAWIGKIGQVGWIRGGRKIEKNQR